MELTIDHLSKTYGGKPVLDIPHLTLRSGELVGLVGNNGAGKTTLLRLMLDLVEADTGCVESGGNAVDKTDRWKQYTGSYLDDRFLIDFLTPDEYFSFVASVYGLSPSVLAERLAPYRLLIEDEILGTRKYLRDLSEGNRQKTGIVGAMLIRPQVLLLDEPFNYLDPSSQLSVAHLLQRMNREDGTTVLLSSHNLSYVTDICTRVLLLERGIVVADLDNTGGAARPRLEAYFAQHAE